MKKTDTEKLLDKHQKLVQSDNRRVLSHVQRESQEEDGEWVQHTLMIEGVDVPFKYKRKQQYQSLKGARVNLTYYPAEEEVAGMTFEIMKVVRLKRS